eukprot:1006065-Rhodomonas_salina.2
MCIRDRLSAEGGGMMSPPTSVPCIASHHTLSQYSIRAGRSSPPLRKEKKTQNKRKDRSSENRKAEMPEPRRLRGSETRVEGQGWRVEFQGSGRAGLGFKELFFVVAAGSGPGVTVRGHGHGSPLGSRA